MPRKAPGSQPRATQSICIVFPVQAADTLGSKRPDRCRHGFRLAAAPARRMWRLNVGPFRALQDHPVAGSRKMKNRCGLASSALSRYAPLIVDLARLAQHHWQGAAVSVKRTPGFVGQGDRIR